MAEISINNNVLNWALERSGKKEVVVGKFPNVTKWLSGDKKPTLRQLEAFAKAAAIPFGYLFLQEPLREELPIPMFRTVDDGTYSRPSPELLDTIQIMEQRQAWLRDSIIAQGGEPLSFIRSAQVQTQPETVAAGIRVVLSLEVDWASGYPTWTAALRELQKKIERAKIVVNANGVVGNNTHRKLDPGEFRGFVLVDEYAPLVFINSADSKAAQMFTLAHELAHLWLGSSAAFDLRELQSSDDATEKACDRIAAEFLIAGVSLQRLWPTISDTDRYQAIARYYKVSELVVARRALDLGLINRLQFLDFYREYQKRERTTTTESSGSFYDTQNLRLGHYFAENVLLAVRSGSLLYRDAYRLTGLYGKTFEQYADKLGFGAS